jgi:putative transposase
LLGCSPLTPGGRHEEKQIFRGTDRDSGTPDGRRCPDPEVTRRFGISEAKYYVWRKRYGQMAVAEIRRLRQLEDENRKLKQLLADLTLDKVMLQKVLVKKA